MSTVVCRPRDPLCPLLLDDDAEVPPGPPFTSMIVTPLAVDNDVIIRTDPPDPPPPPPWMPPRLGKPQPETSPLVPQAVIIPPSPVRTGVDIIIIPPPFPPRLGMVQH